MNEIKGFFDEYAKFVDDVTSEIGKKDELFMERAAEISRWLDGNFSRADGEAVGSTALNAEYGATLDRVSLDTWRAHWNRDDVSYYLTNFDGAEESAITEIADTLMKSN